MLKSLIIDINVNENKYYKFNHVLYLMITSVLEKDSTFWEYVFVMDGFYIKSPINNFKLLFLVKKLLILSVL